jgi:hypothetical protein
VQDRRAVCVVLSEVCCFLSQCMVAYVLSRSVGEFPFSTALRVRLVFMGSGFFILLTMLGEL